MGVVMPVPDAVLTQADELRYAQAHNLATALDLLAKPLRRASREGGLRWARDIAAIADKLADLQVLSAAMAPQALTAMLAAQGVDVGLLAALNPEGFAGFCDGGNGLPRTLVFAPNSLRRRFVGGELEHRFATVATLVVSDAFRDTARAAMQVSMNTRRAELGYVRVLTTPSCARCAVLAGRFYSSRTPFDRHNGCDCRHAPRAEVGGGDGWVTDPEAYFRSLSAQRQDELFTAKGAQAIRGGASVASVVNPWRGVSSMRRATLVRDAGRRDGAGVKRLGPVRLLPDELYHQADTNGWSKGRLLDALRSNGYIY